MHLDPQALRGALISQRDAAQWYFSARRWRENAELTGGAAYAQDCLRWACEDQRIAAQLSLADRTFRGLEG